MKPFDIDPTPYRLVFEGSPAAFALLHILKDGERYDDFVFVYANAGYEKMYGFSAEELNGQPYSRLWGGNSSEWNALYGSVAYEGKPYSSVIFSKEIGRYISLQCHQVKPGYCAVLALDITQEVQAKQRANHEFQRKYELEQQRTLHDRSIMAYAVFNLQRHETIELERNAQLAPIAPDASLEEFRSDVAASILLEEHRQQYCAVFDPASLMQKHHEGKDEQFVEFMRRLPDGKVIWVKARFFLIDEPNGTDMLLIYSCTDINLHKSLEIMTARITEEDYDMLGYVNFADDSAIMWYGTNSIKSSHRADNKLVEEKYSEALEWFVSNAIVPEEREQYRTSLFIHKIKEELSLHEQFTFTVHTCTQGGEILTKEIRYMQYNRDADVCMFTQTDITALLAKKEAEKKVLENALHQMQQANAAQSDFLAKMSHELRTPLNVIIGSSSLASDLPDTNPEMEGYVRQIDYSAKYLLSVINDILDTRKMERGEFKLLPSWERPGQVLTPTIAMMAAEFQNHGIRFLFDENRSVEPDIEYELDVVRCRQVFTNLLNNALKFTPAGGTVSFYDKHVKRTENLAYERFTVSDTGCGMSKAFQKKMFEPFTQERTAANASVQGTGLGLSVVKQLIDAMNGTIEVDSELNRGTTFTITIPFPWRVNAVVQPSGNEEPTVEHLAGKHILLVEDHPMNAVIATKLLEKKGVIVDTAANGAEGVAAFEKAEDRYDLILMDIRMPIMDGLEASKKIRSLPSPKAKAIPIVAMTANAYDDDIRQSLAAGMNAHLAKPIDPTKMYETIAGFLK